MRVTARIVFPGFTLSVTLHLPGQGVVALFGHSGSGKSTLLRVVAGLERAPHGFVQVNGTVWQDEARGLFLPTHQRSIGYVFQDAALFPHLDVWNNLLFGVKRVVNNPARPALEQVIEMLGIAPLLKRKPATLSGGERQRVAIARALAVTPELLLMDEPLAALDVARKREILPYLERLHRELAIPVLYVTHSPEEVARLADHLVVLEAGQVLASGPLQETLARIDVPIRLGEESGVVIDAIIGARDQEWHLARADFTGGMLWIRDPGVTIGQAVRVSVLARDVSLAAEPQSKSSILNLLPGEVSAMIEDTHPANVLVRVVVGPTPFLARITRRSVAALDLTVRKSVWVQVKSAALMESA
ncbi:MAG: molybdenum ABC transporter ATP-binding protein [Magnetococcales bacterium]|nr:molybdenum ABC transporter ATP-binding protein [Magnetococcales bacterium]